MATPRKKKPIKKVATVREAELTPLEIHAIQINEYYKALRKAGFDAPTAITLVMEPALYPHWFKLVPDLEALDEEDNED